MRGKGRGLRALAPPPSCFCSGSIHATCKTSKRDFSEISRRLHPLPFFPITSLLTCLEGSAFGTVFLRAKLIGAALVKTLFLTPDISFHVDTDLLPLGTKTVYILVENRYCSN